MTTRRSRSTKPPAGESDVTIDLGEIARAAEKSFSDADAERVGTLNDLVALRTARSHILARKRDAVAARAGASAGEVKALDRSVSEVASMIKSFRAQGDLAAKQPPAAKPGEVVVHGAIDGDRVAGVKITLADDAGPIKGATATTDAAGHFELRYTAGEKKPKSLRLVVDDERHPQPLELELEPDAEPVRFVVVRLEA